MDTRSPVIAEESSSGPIRTVARALGGLVLALAVAGGIGGWNLAHQRDAGPAARATAGQRGELTAVTVVGHQQAGDTAARAHRRESTRDPGRTYYLVDADAQAATLRQRMEAQGQRAGSELPFTDVVVVVDAEEAARIFAAAALASDPQTAHLGLSPLRVIDLRAR